ncbi:hypothetical protein [Streptomyces sp. B1I3]|uniref:hypothetical protein n=1 Tax=Streptomyces sp. B1I3 TaxID=3042264 RepID=UPI0027D76D07|nr:hypothetical protein [Streptomyces sp. B1I3]
MDPPRIGAYLLLAPLGAGGMGQVFLGRSPGGRLVAVKVIRDEIGEHPEAPARFRREAATVEAVRSACTAQLIEASLDGPPYWLATEYVAGPTLSGAVRDGGPFPPGSALKLFAGLAERLAAVLATGRPPYGSGDAATVSYRAVHEDIDLAGVHLGLAALIRACVAKDSARFHA